MNIPPEFWKSLTDEQYWAICKTSVLDRRMCRRLWAMVGRTDKPPHKLFVMLNTEDVMRLFPAREDYQ